MAETDRPKTERQVHNDKADEEVCKRIRKIIKRRLHRCGEHDENRIEDISQDTLATLWKRGKLNSEDAKDAYVLIIAGGIWLDVRAKERRWVSFTDMPEGYERRP